MARIQANHSVLPVTNSIRRASLGRRLRRPGSGRDKRLWPDL